MEVDINRIMNRDTEIQRTYDNLQDEIRDLYANIYVAEQRLKSYKSKLRHANKLLTKVKNTAKQKKLLYALYL